MVRGEHFFLQRDRRGAVRFRKLAYPPPDRTGRWEEEEGALSIVGK